MKDLNSMLSELLGKPVTAEELFEKYVREDYAGSWTNQSPEARKSRMKYILQMAAELQEIRKVTIQATGFCEFAIEGVITGKIADVRMWSEGLTFPEEELDYRERMTTVFARFREICDEAMAAMLTFDFKMKKVDEVSS